jgi:hypothetical protein
MKKILAVSVFLFVCSSAAFCEHFYLRSGEEVSGRIVSETTTTVKIIVSGSGKQRVLQIKDIFEISAKKKAVAPKPAETYGVEYAKTAFTSDKQTSLTGAQEYVTDNKSGVLIYSVKETEQLPENKTSDTAVNPTSAGDDEFDAAAYLLSGQNTESASPAPSSKPEAKSSAGKTAAEDDEFDAAAYLLGKSAPEPKAAKPARQQRPPQDDEFDAAAYLLGTPQPKKTAAASSSSSKAKEKESRYDNDNYDASKYRIKDDRGSLSGGYKPDNETLLALSFDLKGSVSFDGTTVKESNDIDLSGESDYGISVSAEHYAYLTNLFALGLGGEYNFQRYLHDSGRYSFIPLFIAAKMRIVSGEILDGSYHLYATARLGYGIFMANSSYWLGDTHGGVYCAGGIGASYERFTLQLLYSYNGAKVNHKVAADELDAGISFSKLGIYFGYLF